MKELSYVARFNTPAFLGDAEQQAQWRTPPFKALLRQWWRIVVAPQCRYDHTELRQLEGTLFGQAHENNINKSQVRIRLNACNWGEGALRQWPAGEAKVTHPEVKFPVGTELYLGYGPLAFNKVNKGTSLGVSKSSEKQMNAIEPEKQSAELWVGCPDAHYPQLAQSLQLIAWFGTLGSRSRNGWGSLRLDNTGLPDSASLAGVTRPLKQCLALDWPHAIGRDDKGTLIWTTQAYASWREAMQALAKAKIAFRTHFIFTTGKFSPKVEPRHILAYPVTNHSVTAWGNQGRLANQIRFKVSKQGDRYVGLITHLPCKLPDELAGRLPIPNELNVWQQVHQVLDSHAGLSRLK